MLIKLHPLTKTDIEARRGIERLKNFAELNPEDALVTTEVVSDMITKLRELRDLIPSELQEAK